MTCRGCTSPLDTPGRSRLHRFRGDRCLCEESALPRLVVAFSTSIDLVYHQLRPTASLCIQMSAHIEDEAGSPTVGGAASNPSSLKVFLGGLSWETTEGVCAIMLSKPSARVASAGTTCDNTCFLPPLPFRDPQDVLHQVWDRRRRGAWPMLEPDKRAFECSLRMRVRCTGRNPDIIITTRRW